MPTGRMNTRTFFPLVSAIAALFMVSGAHPGAAAEQKSCVTSGCHSDMGQEQYVHGPVAMGECTFCHQPAGGDHSFKPIKNVGKLCNDCHDKKPTGRVVHAPVKDGECAECHDPHQSPNPYQLRGGADLCFRCHDRDTIGGKYVHGPVAVGSCTTCHHAHESDFAKLLTAEGNEVCFTCHADKAEAFKGKKYVHTPVQELCTNCHNPHGGEYRYNLSAPGKKELCLTCHEDKRQHIDEAKVKHGGLNTEKGCLACHDPHASDYVDQLQLQPADLCLSCHDREYKKGKNRVANMKALLEQNKDHHGPVRQKDCSACHDPHGSDNFRILREPFPPLFYADYDVNNYRLCFMCHEETIAEEELTTTLTNFRNGQQNLHYVHVNKAEKSRTCRACHDAHATNNPKHIRDAVPFGSWNLPINFQKTETGGQCLPGCHQLFKYDRKRPVFNR